MGNRRGSHFGNLWDNNREPLGLQDLPQELLSCVFFPARPNPPKDTCPTKAGFRPSVLSPPVRTSQKTLAKSRPGPRPSEPAQRHLPRTDLRPSVLFPARPNLQKDTCQKSVFDQVSFAPPVRTPQKTPARPKLAFDQVSFSTPVRTSQKTLAKSRPSTKRLWPS